MNTLGIIALVLGLASFIAGMVSYALNRAAPRSDERVPGAGEADLDLFRIDDETIEDETVEPDMEHPGAAEVRNARHAAATHVVGN